jgi:uncharacterized protein (TIGR02300 family)
VAKAEWGLKRTCLSCGAKFYDMMRAPILCPKCGATFDPEVQLKARRAKVPPPKAAPVEEVEAAEAEPAAEGKEEEEEAVMEDTSELGQDSDDVDEVVDPASGEPEER